MPAWKLLLVGGLILWIAVVFVAYYAVHKPLPEGMAQAGVLWGLMEQGWSGPAVVDASLNLGVALWLLLVGLGVGSLLVEGILGRADAGLLERATFGTALGLGCLSFAFLGLGLAGWLAPQPVVLTLALFSGAAVFGLGRLLLQRPPWSLALRELVVGNAYLQVLKALLGLLALLLITRALTPPVAWDSLVYHLVGPLRYIRAGGIIGGIDIPHAYFPSLVEQLFTAALLVKGDVAARLLHLSLAAVGAASLYGFLTRHQGPGAGWLGLALLASATSLLTLATQAYVEWGLLTFGFLAFWALHESIERESLRWLILSGCCAGLALGVKYTGVFLIAPLGLLLLWRAAHPYTAQGRRAFPDWYRVALWCGVVAVVASPWYLKNLALTGNPVYPFLLGGWNWDAWKAQWFSRPGTGLITEPVRLLAAPWELTVLGTEGGAFYDVNLGPLFLGMLPLLLLRLPTGQAGPTRPWVGRALLVVLVGYGAWLYGAAQSELLVQGRLLLPVLPFLAPLVVSGLVESVRLDLPFLRIGFFLRAAVLLVVVLTMLTLTLAWIADPPLPYLAGAESRAAYQERHLGDHYRALSFLNQELPAAAKVVFLWEPRSYLCRVECQPDALLYNWRYALFQHQTPDAVGEALKAAGYTHLLLYGGGFRYFSEPPNVEVEGPHIAALLEFEKRYLERIYGPSLLELLTTPAQDLAGSGYAVYRLRQ